MSSSTSMPITDPTQRLLDLLKITRPVVQAPCTWITSAELAAAVSEAGGLGCLGPNAGRTTPMRVDHVDEARESLREEVRKLRTLTHRPFGVNFVTPPHTGAVDFMTIYSYIASDVIVQEKVPVVIVANSSGIEQARPFLKRFREAGTTIVYRDVTPTVSKAIEAEKAGAHVYVATGHGSGGHLSRTKAPTVVIVPQIVDALHIPVLAAGGVYDERTAAAMRAVGAAGVYAGTRFIVATECRASMVAKQAILAVKSEDLIEYGDETRSSLIIPPLKGVKALDRTRSPYQTGLFEGDLVAGYVNVSASAGAINHISPAVDIVAELAKPFATTKP